MNPYSDYLASVASRRQSLDTSNMTPEQRETFDLFRQQSANGEFSGGGFLQGGGPPPQYAQYTGGGQRFATMGGIGNAAAFATAPNQSPQYTSGGQYGLTQTGPSSYQTRDGQQAASMPRTQQQAMQSSAPPAPPASPYGPQLSGADLANWQAMQQSQAMMAGNGGNPLGTFGSFGSYNPGAPGTPGAGYMPNPEGLNTIDGTKYSLNGFQYLGDQATTDLASRLGGTGVQINAPGSSPYKLPPQNQLVFDQTPNTMYNAGLVQQRFDNYSPDLANQMMQDELKYNAANRLPSLQERQGGVQPNIFGTWPGGIGGGQISQLGGGTPGGTTVPQGGSTQFGNFFTQGFGGGNPPATWGAGAWGPGGVPGSGGMGPSQTGGSTGTAPTYPGAGGGSGTGATGGGTNPWGSQGTSGGGGTGGGSNPWGGFTPGTPGAGGGSGGGTNIFNPGGSGFNPNGGSGGGGGTSPFNSGGVQGGAFGQGPQIDMPMGGGGGQTNFAPPSMGQGGQASNPFNPSMSQGLRNFAGNGGAFSGAGSNMAGWSPFQVAAAPSNTQVNVGDRQRYNAGPDVDYYRGLVQNGGSPIDQTPAWEAMKQAQQRTIDRQGADLEEGFNVSGNRFSTAFGNAATDFRSQTAKDQNAQLLAAQTQALENARGRQYQGAGALSGLAYQDAWKQGDLDAQQTDARIRGAQVNQAPWMMQQQIGAQMSGLDQQNRQARDQMGLSAYEAGQNRQFGAAQQLGQMDLQAGMQANQLNAQMGMQEQDIMSRYGLQAQQFAGQGGLQAQQLAAQSYQQEMARAQQAAMMAAGGADNAASQMAGIGAQGAMGLNNTAMQGAMNLWSGENQGARDLWQGSNQAGMAMYNGQNQMFPQMMNYDMGLRQMGLGGARDLSNLWGQNLALGSQLGNQEFGMDAFNTNRVFEEWLRTQPENNPLIPYLFSAATAQPAVMNPQFRPSAFGQIAGATGGLMQGMGAMGWSPFGGGRGGSN